MRTRPRKTLLLALAALLAFWGNGTAADETMQGFGAGTADLPAAFEITPFYEVEGGLSAEEPGTILKAEPIEAPEGANAWRIMYVSRDVNDKPIPVTGLVIAPKGEAPVPRPVLSWAHGTTGTARGCAPSLAKNPARAFHRRGGEEKNPIDIGIPWAADFLDQGFVIAATDYNGLGAPGAHHYLVGETTARNTLDIARAASRIGAAKAGSDVMLLGWSQGGQAALFAGEIAETYAPELTLRGITALAPAATLPEGEHLDAFYRAPVPHAYLTANGFHAAYGLPLDAFNVHGTALLEAAKQGCVLDVFNKIAATDAPGVTKDMSKVDGWEEAHRRGQAGQKKSAAPVLILHGTADNVVLPVGSALYQERACASGTQLALYWQDGADHRTLLDVSREQVLAWIANRLHGEAPRVNCPSP